MTPDKRNGLSRILRQRRVMIPLTLQELATRSGVSLSHIGRIDRGDRFPSASTLQKIANPLGFSEVELFTLAGYLSPGPSGMAKEAMQETVGELDPYTVMILALESVEVQRTVAGLLSILKELAKAVR